ncbi:MBG domain-containing protein, partial [Collinsella intestinalis]|uniref:MBG domain-containing protein n=1 Tax=Collinsella intestinalis TaxID=147207 RepID=UPI00195BE266
KYYGKDAETGEYTVELAGEPVDAGDYRVVATWTETDNYPSLSDYCDFTVAPATLTVTTKSDSKAYDGAALTAPSTAEEAVSGLQNGEAVAFKVTGSQTEVGWSTNTYEIDWDAEETTAKKSNYTVTENLGTLEVTKGDAADYDADVTISGWTYNGQFDPQGTLSSEAESEADGATVSCKYYGKDAETGEYTVELAGEPVDAGDYRVVATWTETDNYPSLSDYCDFTIEKRPVELTGSGWATDQPYTGKAYGKTDFETEAFDAEADRGLVEGQKLSGVSYEISGTEVGPYEGKFSGTPVVKAEGSDDDLAANYSFSYEVGKLNIVESAIAQYVTLDPADVSEVYDGQAHAAGTAKATDKNGKTAKVEYSVDGEKWTENPAEITATNVSDSVTVKVRASVPGTYTGYVEGTQELEITARPVTITVADDSKVFGQDDPVFEDAVMTNHVKGELADIDLSVIRSNEEEGVDHYEDVLTIGQTAEELNGLYGNYTFTVEPGDFEITQQTINPEDPDNPDSYLNVQVSQPADVTYNGQHQQSPVKVERLDADGNVIATLEEGVDYKLTYVDDVNAGTAKVKVEGKGNYKGQITKEYTINPAKAMIVVSNNAKVYGEDDPDFQGKVVLYNDGACDQPLYLNVLTRKQDVLGDIAYSRTNAEVESAGTYEGVLTAAVKDGTLNGNYTYDVWPGDFHIAKSTDLVAKITSTAEDMTKVYDGKALTLTAEATPAEGSTLMYSTDGGTTWTDEAPSITNVGTLDVQVKAVNPNYEDSYPVEATLTVTAAPLTITTPSAAKVFDGTPLEAPGSAEECVTGLKNGETVDFKTTGTITAVGQTDNTYAIVFAGEEGATEATAQSGNYRIVTEDLGTLQVFPQSVDPDDPDPSNPDPDDPDPSKPDPENPDQPFYTGITVEWPGNTRYNGKSQELPVTVKDRNGNVLTQSTDGGKTGDYVLVYGDDTVNAGEVKVTVKGVNNYGGEISGSYQITPVTLTISTPSAAKVYDGTALTTGEDSATVEGLMDDDQVQTTVYGSQTEADVSANHVRIDGWVNTEPTNYDVRLNLGTLLVYPQSINPGDPDPSNPDPDDPNPNEPNPENPKQPFYSGATVDSPSDLTYDGADHTWEPTVRDAQGNVLVLNRDYAVTYSKADRTNVTGAIEVTITGMGDYAGTVTRTYQITPREIVLTIDNQTKVAGTADPTFTSSYEGTVPGEVAGWSFQTGHVRDAGEAVGSYAINQGDMQLADNPSTGFLASNYTLRVIPGTLTITPAPATPGDGGTGTNPGTNPGGGTGTNPGAGTTATPTPATATDGTAAAATDATAEAIEDEATPLAAGTERISDDETPLASGREDRDCWVHWLMLVGLVISAVYYLGAVIHRRKFTADLEGYEKDVLDPDNRNA